MSPPRKRGSRASDGAVALDSRFRGNDREGRRVERNNAALASGRKENPMTAAERASAHDHQHCIDDALVRAATICAQSGGRLTPLRRRVLELVWHSHAPVGAYDILDALRRDGRPAAPPTAYRALEFLLGHGLIHRIESLNAFVGCAQPERPHL